MTLSEQFTGKTVDYIQTSYNEIQIHFTDFSKLVLQSWGSEGSKLKAEFEVRAIGELIINEEGM